MKKLIDQIMLFFGIREQESKTVVVQFQLPNGKKFGVEAVDNLLEYHREYKCKKHWDYQGLAVPTNNCNDCWEYYSKKAYNK